MTVEFSRAARPDGSIADSVNLTLLAANIKKKVTRRVNRDAGISVHDPRVSPVGDVSYQVVMGIDLPPGPYQLRASARSDGLREVRQRLPDGGRAGNSAKTGVAILGPALGLARDRALDETMKGELLPMRPVLDRVFSAPIPCASSIGLRAANLPPP